MSILTSILDKLLMWLAFITSIVSIAMSLYDEYAVLNPDARNNFILFPISLSLVSFVFFHMLTKPVQVSGKRFTRLSSVIIPGALVLTIVGLVRHIKVVNNSVPDNGDYRRLGVFSISLILAAISFLKLRKNLIYS